MTPKIFCRIQEVVVRSNFLMMKNRKNDYDCSEIYSNFHYLNATDTNRNEGLWRKSSSSGFVLFYLPRWKREDKADDALHQVFEDLQMQKTT